MWCMFGHGRKNLMCNLLKCSRHNLEQLINARSNKRSFTKEINIIEHAEMFNVDRAKANMIRAAEHIAHNDFKVRKRAYSELTRWAEIYADLNKVMK